MEALDAAIDIRATSSSVWQRRVSTDRIRGVAPRKVFHVLVILLATCGLAAAQQPTIDSASLSMLQQSFAALAPGSSLPSSATTPLTIVATGSYTRASISPPVTYPLRISVLGPDKFRREVDAPKGTYKVIVRGRMGWFISPGKQATALSVGDLSGIGREDFPLLVIAKAVAENTAIIQTLEASTSSGRTLDHISICRIHGGGVSTEFEQKFENATRMELFLDQQTHLPARVRYYEHPGDWRIDDVADVVFSDYRNVNGLLFPFNVVRYVNGHRMSEIQYQSVQFNVPVADSTFTPEAAQ